MTSFFKDLKVIELASVLAGPSVGMFFAELGADVIKVENKRTNGDVTRSWKLAGEDDDHPFSAYYSSVNFGKKSLFLDLSEKYDYELLIKEIITADIVLVNFKYGDAIKFKLDYEHLKKINPHILYGEINGFGNSKRIAYDIVLQAESGFLSMNGTKNGEICKIPVALIDIIAAHQLKEGLLVAMIQQQKTNKSFKVSVSLFDAATSALVNQATNWLMGNEIAKPLGTLHPNIAPYGETFSCKDNKQITLAVGSNRQFKALCKVLDLDYLITLPTFQSNQERVINRVNLQTILEEKIQLFNRDELMTLFLDFKVPAGAIRNIEEVFNLKEGQNRIIKEQKEGKELIAVRGNCFTIST